MYLLMPDRFIGSDGSLRSLPEASADNDSGVIEGRSFSADRDIRIATATALRQDMPSELKRNEELPNGRV
jgi:hypothetical protein